MKKEVLKDNLKTAISQLGGIKAVADRFEIPYRTVQNWSDGTRTPPIYVAKMIIEVEKQERKNDGNYKAYIEEQEGLAWYEKELERKKQKVTELEARNGVLQEQLDAMVELAQKRREHIEANEAAIDQLEKALDATREELAKERHAREVWARQAGMLAGR